MGPASSLAPLPQSQRPLSTPLESSAPNQATEQQLKQLLKHISLTWSSLVRSNLSIIDLVNDPKVPLLPGQRHRLYLNPIEGEETVEEIRNALVRGNPEGDLDRVEVLALPAPGQKIEDGQHGALYLPYPYVVPGGVFQEMYAWDSFFIALGLLRDNQFRLARNILDNYIYQIERYGTILNGNRTYYLTRSQLPFLTTLIKLIYPIIPATHAQSWLRKAVAAAEKYHAYWVTGSHHVQQTGLSRFFDSGPSGSIPPEIAHEVDSNGASAYERVRRFFRENCQKGIPDYDITEYYDTETDTLKARYMDSDRAMRESGFDTSHRFGPFNAKILDFNPVCLNALLVQMETDLAELHAMLEPADSAKSQIWATEASVRRELMVRYNWDEDHGLFYDYDFVRGERRKYTFGTTFVPLWTGLATPQQAARVAKGGLAALEMPGGLATSDRDVGCQWDKPYAWAPLQLFAVEGLQRYGFVEEAERLAANFGSMVLKTWIRTGELWEKYHAVQRDESVFLKYGYSTNEVGFGWSNAIFTRFYDLLSPLGRQNLLRLDGIPLPPTRSPPIGATVSS
ncbi:hypothetical protein CROQUDRAFT_43863 [Cronartium quercuum f. sp. fusiforme G11]|uniref:Trehalase n=1 Tax=Cronartium quercuum f. sp. fusiforme G11 TaxID=708437 RepID=A0A9P6TBY3_9BASI|nr:hypothetical protein CROQUDRAFT_43863 [Cronartium quercuum f. sp. fusiforme G11]